MYDKIGVIANRLPNSKVTELMDIGDMQLLAAIESDEELARADVFLIPSLWEGLPVALLEAMYQEKLCIASRVIGNRDVMINGENGFLADCYEDYVRILKDVSSAKIPVEEIQKRAKQDVVESYSTTKMCGEYLRVYREDMK